MKITLPPQSPIAFYNHMRPLRYGNRRVAAPRNRRFKTSSDRERQIGRGKAKRVLGAFLGLLGLACSAGGPENCPYPSEQPQENQILILAAESQHTYIVCLLAENDTNVGKDGQIDYSEPRLGADFDGAPLVYCFPPGAQDIPDSAIPLVSGPFDSAPGKIAIPSSTLEYETNQLTNIIVSYYTSCSDK